MSDWDDDLREAMSKRRASVLDMAHEIIAMQNTIWRQEAQIARMEEYEQKYNDLIQSNIRHGEKMMGNMLSLLVTPGVGEALAKNGKAENFYHD